jgi:four helix bundle protein
MDIFRLSKAFPHEERFSLTDQIRRSSRSVCAAIAEAWRKRAYPRHFVSKITDAESEAEETRVWLQFAYGCGYLAGDEAKRIDDTFDHIIGQLVLMKQNPGSWSTGVPKGLRKRASPTRPLAHSPRRGEAVRGAGQSEAE